MKMRKPSELDRKRPLFFAIGLCISLASIYSIFQYKTYQKALVFPASETVFVDDGLVIPITKPKLPEPVKQVNDIKKTQRKIFANAFLKVPDYMSDYGEDTLFFIEEITNWGTTQMLDTMEINIQALDKKPIFPGCEELLTEKERFQCFQEKLAAFVATNYKPCQSPFGVTKELLYVKFVIDEKGNSGRAEIVRGYDDCNMREALNLVGKIPSMKPGKYRDKSVRTSFVLPIRIK